MPRVGLTPDKVVAAAIGLADERGLSALSLALLADQVGVRVPSLYKHVDGLADLRRRMSVVGRAALSGALVRAGDGRAGRDALVSIAQAYRRFARVHPGQYQAALLPGPPDSSDPIGERLGRVVGDYKIIGDDAAHAVRAIRGSLHGFVTLEATDGFGPAATMEASFYSMLALLDRGLGGWQQPGKSSGGLLSSLLRPIR
jgi:AcrR family transcriptional regulator